jgi:hypothetical protein
MPAKVPPAKPVSTIAQGVAATIRLVKEDTGTGRYFNSLGESRASDQAYDTWARSRLRPLSRELAGV